MMLTPDTDARILNCLEPIEGLIPHCSHCGQAGHLVGECLELPAECQHDGGIFRSNGHLYCADCGVLLW